MDELLSEFLAESGERLAELDRQLVRLERTPDDPALLAGIFRLVHTVKGTCGFLGLPRLEALAHAAETVLSRIRAGERAVTPATVGLILETVDCIRAQLATIGATGAEPEGDDAGLIARLNALENGTDTPEPAAPAIAAVPSLPKSGPGAARTVRVSLDLVDELMTTAGELVLSRNRLLRMAGGTEDSTLAAPLRQLDHVTAALQQAVTKTRLQPIGTAWARFPRMVRDLARALGKRIELEMTGAETGLDRQLIEAIADPLAHMVRNAADHGIEMPAARAASGKPETGRIALDARQEGGHVVIRVSDDGRGIDPAGIRQAAVARGIATPAAVAALSDRQVLQFVFSPGFSTAAQVTSLSGRGVGMDVVRANVEQVGGHVELRSEPGRGSSVILRLPLTLAIAPALIVGCAGERFAVPQAAIREIVRVAPRSGHHIEGIGAARVLRLRDRLLPVAELDTLLQLGPAEASLDETFAVVLQAGGALFGIVIDRVFDCEEIVIKPLSPLLRQIQLYAGCTILGDGRVVMILDPDGIAAAIGCADADGPHADAAPAVSADAAAPEPVLLFRAGSGDQRAVPLAPVARLETIEAGAIEDVGGALVTQYRGQLMPMLAVEDGFQRTASGRQPVIVFADGARRLGLMVDEIVDIVEDRLDIELCSGRSGVLGTALIAGRATEIIDSAHYLQRAFGDAVYAGPPRGHTPADARGAA